LGFDGGDVNLYAYASNNPIMFMDPNGLCVKATFKGIGTALSEGLSGGLYALGEAGKFVGHGIKPSAQFLDSTAAGAGIIATATAVTGNEPAALGFGAVALGAKSLKTLLYSNTPYNDTIKETINIISPVKQPQNMITDEITNQAVDWYIKQNNLPQM
jgi:hypothetical protein